jgi:hypothetical protein
MGAFAVCALSQQSLFLSHTRRLISLLNGPESALGVRAAAGLKTLALGGGDVIILYEKRSRRNNIWNAHSEIRRPLRIFAAIYAGAARLTKYTYIGGLRSVYI